MSHKTITVLVVLCDGPHALGRLIARCHARSWAPVAMRTVSDGARCEVTMRLRVPDDRRGTEAQVHAQLERLVEKLLNFGVPTTSIVFSSPVAERRLKV